MLILGFHLGDIERKVILQKVKMTKHTCENGHCENYEIVLFSGDFD